MAPMHKKDVVGIHGRGAPLVDLSIIFGTVAAVVVTLRVSTRLLSKAGLGSDDYIIVCSMLLSIGMGIANCIAVHHGYGQMAVTLDPQDLRIALKSFWAVQILYKATINLTKLSILCLYLRLFPSKVFRKWVHIILALVICYALSSIAATIVECRPVPRTWDRRIPGTCVNLTIFWYTNAIVNIVGDFCILIMPISVLSSLQLPQRQKYSLILVFALADSVCITSILRMTTLDQGSKAKDQNWGTLTSTKWTTIEANTGIVCACLPMLRAPLRCLWPTLCLMRRTNEGSSRLFSAGMHAPRQVNSWVKFGSDDGQEVQARAPIVPSPGHEASFAMNTITKRTDIQVGFDQQDGAGEGSSMSPGGINPSHSLSRSRTKGHSCF